VVYDKTGDVGLDMALDFLGKLGFDPADPGMVAAGNGDFSILRAQLAVLGDKAPGWEQMLALGEKAHGARLGVEKERQATDRKAIHDEVGGEDKWKAIHAWASANAEPAERDAVNAALNQGGLVAKATAAYLAGLHAKAPGTVIDPAAAMAPGAAGRPDTSNGPLDAAGYKTGIAALVSKHGTANLEARPEYKALGARRLAGANLR
jgi:hypothetical protein